MRRKVSSIPWSVIFSLGVFLLVLFFTSRGLHAVSCRTEEASKTLLDDALHRSIIHCYAIEGRYPESLTYLETHYGLTYDKSTFFVDYQPLGEDLPPDVTVLVRDEVEQ